MGFALQLAAPMDELDPELTKLLYEVFTRVCRTLQVSPTDSLSQTIARTVILIALDQGVRDPNELYERTLDELRRAMARR